MPELTIGSPPRGGDYFDQEDLIEAIWSHLKKDNVLLVAPRRFGKTGTMYRLIDDPRDEFIPVYMDVEPIVSAADFIIELIANLIKKHHFLRIAQTIWTETKKFGKFIRNLPSTIDFGGLKVEIREQTDIEKQWLDYGEQIKSLLSKGSKPLLLVIDEFPIMIGSIFERDYEEARQFLRWFRSLRILPDTKARFVLGGSINLVSTLEYYGLVDTVNDVVIKNVEPFTKEVAERYIEEIFAANQIPLAKDVKETVLTLIGTPIPYLLAVLLQAILNRAKVQDCEITPAIVTDVFEDDLLTGSTSVTFQHYRARIDQYPYYASLEARAGKEILGELSRAEGPVKRDTLYHIYLKTGNRPPGVQSREEFLRLMNKLENDFYITAENDAYVFYSRVLKIWWKTHYGWQ